jgi:uncharacterized protein involved in copper resistance
MTIKKHLLHCLLAFCIGMLPVLSVSAASLEHTATAPMDCADCGPMDMDHGDLCEHQDCASITQSCQSSSAASCLPAAAALETAPGRLVGNPDRSDAPGLREINDSIYRPPIT